MDARDSKNVLSSEQRSLRISEIEAEMMDLFRMIDALDETGPKLKLWWRVEDLRFELEEICGGREHRFLPKRRSAS